jgi:hypothetical protein
MDECWDQWNVCVCVCTHASIRLGCNCRIQPCPHHFLMHYLMALKVAKVMYGALVEWYCPGNWSTGRKICPSVELSTASLVPTVITLTTDIQVHMAVQISNLIDTSPHPVNHLSLASSIYSESIIVLSVSLLNWQCWRVSLPSWSVWSQIKICKIWGSHSHPLNTKALQQNLQTC